jgi:hypothetical protein
MVVHQTEYMNHCIISFCSRFKIFKKLFPVTLALEYIFPFITPGSHMIKGAGIGYSQGTSHYLSFLYSAKVITNLIAFYQAVCQECDPVIFFVSNKTESAKSVVLLHNGRGSQECIFGDAKNDAALNVIPSRRLAGNQPFTLCAMMAHNLSREIQMLAAPSAPRVLPKRPASWTFEKLDTLRHRIIQRAGRLIRPQGKSPLQ